MQQPTRTEGVAQLCRRRPPARGRQCGQGGRIGFAVRERLQHAPGADAQQVRHEAGHLDVRFLEQRFQPVLELHAVAGDLILAPHHGAPEPLLGVRHKAQGQFLGDQALHQPFGIRKVLLAAAGAAIRLRLGEVQRPREATRGRTLPTLRPPVLFQGFPHRPPVLRGRFHHDFLDFVLDQPVGQSAQIRRRRADLLAFEVKVPVDLDVGHHNRQHLLVDVNSRDPVRHRSLPRGSGERASSHQSGSRAIAGPVELHDAQLFGQSRTLRIKQLLGLTGSTG